jgi:anti-anti-sigma regulatory factor
MARTIQTIQLPAECNAQWACSQHEALARLDHSHIQYRLDAAEVGRMTTPAVQLLVALAQATAGEGGQIRIEAPSPAFLAAFADLGLEGLADEWGVKLDG